MFLHIFSIERHFLLVFIFLTDRFLKTVISGIVFHTFFFIFLFFLNWLLRKTEISLKFPLFCESRILLFPSLFHKAFINIIFHFQPLSITFSFITNSFIANSFITCNLSFTNYFILGTFYTSSSSLSSSDFLNPLSPLVLIVHCSRQAF